MAQPESTILATDVDDEGDTLRDRPICDVCLNCLQSLTESLSPPDKRGNRQTPQILHHETFESFRHSVEVLHCWICDIFINKRLARGEGSPPRYPRDVHGYSTMDMSFEENRRAGQEQLVLTFHFPEQNLIQWLADAEGLSSIRRPDCLKGNTGQELSSPTSIVKEWIKTCHTKHESCRRVSDRSGTPGFLPDRLVYVGYRDEDLRLVCGNDISTNETYEYATLSHCWGNSSIFTLTQDNLSSLLRRIPWQEIPKTFIDAVHVSRALGYRYLWIDSLCIIQHGDGKRDWQKQVDDMYRIYANGALNVAALGARNSTEGLFFNRELSTLNTSAEIPLFGKRWRVGELGYWEEAVLEQPLNQRGWVLQERLCSPRTINFGKELLSWECGELGATELYPWGSSRSSLSSIIGKEEVRQVETALAGGHQEQKLDEEFAYGQWSDLIEMYSKMALSRASDRLPAVKALAEKFKAVLRDRYLAGLWCGILAHQLCWGPENDEVLQRNDESGSPSFSWASVNGWTNWRPPTVPTSESHDLIYGLQVHPDIEDDKHAISSTCLSITFNAFLLPLTSKQVYYGNDKVGSHDRLYKCCDNFSQDRSDTNLLGPDLTIDLAFDDPRFELEGDEPPTYGIPCFYEGDRFWPGIRGIAVRPKANEKNHFERIGSFELGWEGDDMAEMELEEVIDYLYDCQTIVQKEMPEGFDVETKRYTITLV